MPLKAAVSSQRKGTGWMWRGEHTSCGVQGATLGCCCFMHSAGTGHCLAFVPWAVLRLNSCKT